MVKQSPCPHIRSPPSSRASGDDISLQTARQPITSTLIQGSEVNRSSSFVIHHWGESVGIGGQWTSSRARWQIVTKRQPRRSSRLHPRCAAAHRKTVRSSRTPRRRYDRSRSRPKPRSEQGSRRHWCCFSNRRCTVTQEPLEATRWLVILATAASSPAVGRPRSGGRNKTFEKIIYRRVISISASFEHGGHLESISNGGRRPDAYETKPRRKERVAGVSMSQSNTEDGSKSVSSGGRRHDTKDHQSLG